MPGTMINGLELYWERTGEAGEPLVLVHGSWGDHTGWDAVVPALAHSFRVLTYDRRGHSRSQRPAGQGSVRDDVADLAALIEHLGLGPAHILGNSFGGTIVLRLAAVRPDLFRSLLVHEPSLIGLLASPAAGSERPNPVRALLEAGQNEGAARLFLETVADGPGAWERLPPEQRDLRTFNAPTFLDEQRDPESRVMDLGALVHFSRPALLTQGDTSAPFFAPILDQVASALPHAQRQTLSGAGHGPHRSHPQAYVAAITGFIRQLGGA